MRDVFDEVSEPQDVFDEVSAGEAEDRPGFGERFVAHPEKFLPVYGGMARTADTAKIVNAAKRLETGDYSKMTGYGNVGRQGKEHDYPGPIGMSLAIANEEPEWTPERQYEADIQTVADWMEETSKNPNWRGTVGDILGEMPAFVGEALLTGGTASVMKAGARKSLEKVLTNRAMKWTGGQVASAAARTALSPQRVASEYMQRELPQGVAVGDDGRIRFEWADENPSTQFAKAWGSVFADWFGEEFGELNVSGKLGSEVFKRLKTKPFADKFVDVLYRGYKRVSPDATKLDFVKKAFGAGQLHNYLDEVGEEYVTAALNAAMNIEDRNGDSRLVADMPQRLGSALWETMKDTPAMLAAFAIPGAAKWGAASLAGKPVDWSEYEGEEHPEEMTSWFEPEPRVMPEADMLEGLADMGTTENKVGGATEMAPEDEEALAQLEGEEEYMISGGGEKGVPQGKVSPELYIGNVTPRAKKTWADALNAAREQEDLPGKDVQATELGPHKEGAFPTKRTRVEMTVDEATDTLAQLEEAMDEVLISGESRSSTELALLKAMWGDIRNLRDSLGLPKGQMPFKVTNRKGALIAEMRRPTERIYAAIEGPSKRTLAEYSHGDLVTQGEAIKAKLKSVAQTARETYRTGKKEGIARLKAQLRELKAKQRTIQAVRQYRKQMIRKVLASVPGSVDPLYAKAIHTMQEKLDPKGRSDKTKRALSGLERELKADPGIAARITGGRGMRLLKRLTQVPSTQISTGQLESLAQERIRLQREGMLQKQKTDAAREIAPVAEALKEQLKEKKVRTDFGAQQGYNAGWFERQWNYARKGLWQFLAGQYRIERMCSFLDGFKRGKFTRLFYEPLKGLAVKARMRRYAAEMEFFDFLKEQKVDPGVWIGYKDTFVLNDGKPLKLSKFEQIGLYLFAESSDSRSHLTLTPQQEQLQQLRKDGKITEEQFYRQWFGLAGEIDLEPLKNRYEIETLTRKSLGLSSADVDMIHDAVAKDEQMKRVADWMAERLNERWDSILRVAREVGIDPNQLVHVSRYLPLLIRNVNYMEQDDLMMQALGQFMSKDLLPEHGFLKTREHASKGTVELDAMLLFLHSTSEVEQFLTMAPMLSRVGRVFADDEFKEMLNDRTCGYGMRMLSKWVSDTARSRIVREQDQASKWLHKLNRWGIIYALGWNIPVIIKQTTGIMNMVAANPRMLPHFVENLVVGCDPQTFDAIKQEVFEKSKFMKDRDIEHILAEQWNKASLRKHARWRLGKGVEKLKGVDPSKEAIRGIRWVDEWTTVYSWKSAYQSALDQGASEEAAIRYADQTIQRTAEMARPEDLPDFFRGGIVNQWMSLFQNQVNQNLNFWVHDIYGSRTHGNITNAEVAYRVMMSYVLPALFLGMINRGFAPPDKEQAILDLTLYGVGAPFFIGGIINNVISGWRSGLGLWGAAVEHPTKAIKAAREGDVRKTIVQAAATIGSFAPGYVTGQMTRTAEGVYDLYMDNTDDPRRLIWSQWALDQGKDSEEE